MRWVCVLATAALAVQVCQAARVIILAPFSSPSQRIYFMALAEALAAKNHSVTLVTRLEPLKPRPNIREVQVPGADVVRDTHNLFAPEKFSTYMNFFRHWSKDCNDALASQEMRRLQEEEFDIVMLSTMLSECFYSFIHRLQVPFIHASPHGLTGIYNDMAYNPQLLSLEPNMLMDLEFPLSFTDRIINTLTDITFRAAFFYFLPELMHECRSRGLCAPDMPSPAQMMLNGSLIIVNSLQTLDTPIRPSVPTVVYVGGIHCKPALPLPHELEEWVAGAGDAGFIYFSLGSVVKTKVMPEMYRKMLLEVFASLEQRVLCKWDQGTKEDLPPNVRLAKWLPQQDILGHPSLRLFITHGGLLSTQEATYHGVPLLGLPVFLDQHYNMRQVRQQGWGLFLRWEDLSHDSLRNHILHLMTDIAMRKEASRRSAVMRDSPVPAGEWAAFWVEYVLRHRGATHLRSPALDMPWYELYNVDVWVLLLLGTLAMLLLSLKVFFVLIRCCWRLLRSPEKHKQQ